MSALQGDDPGSATFHAAVGGPLAVLTPEIHPHSTATSVNIEPVLLTGWQLRQPLPRVDAGIAPSRGKYKDASVLFAACAVKVHGVCA